VYKKIKGGGRKNRSNVLKLNKSFIYLFARTWYNIKQLLKHLHEQDNKATALTKALTAALFS